MRYLPVLLLMFCAMSPCAGTDTTPSTSPPEFSPPRPLPRQDLSGFYPGYPDREALVFVGFTLGADGKTSDPVLLEGGFHNKRFTDAALRLVARMRFIPAMHNGVPVSTRQSMPVRFSIEDSRGITPEYKRELDKVVKLAQSKDYAGAHFHAQWMLSEKVQLNYEYAVLNYTIADTQGRLGNTHRALIASRAATARVSMSVQKYQPGDPVPAISDRDFILTKGVLAPALRLRFALAASQGFYLDALRAHADLQGLGAIPPDDPTIATFAKLLDHVKTSPTLVATVQIDEDGYWDHEPLFARLMVLGIRDGNLQRATYRCAGNDVDIEIRPSVEWSLPEPLSGCSMRFYATPGTSFRLIEIRDLSSQQY